MSPASTPALSIRQPWAWLIVHGFKDVENRDWATNFRGRFLVHAGKTLTRPYYEEQRAALAEYALLPKSFPGFDELRAQCGGIVGEARITGCARSSSSRWYMPGSFAWGLEGGRAAPFMPLNGRLGFFDVDLRACAAGLPEGLAP